MSAMSSNKNKAKKPLRLLFISHDDNAAITITNEVMTNIMRVCLLCPQQLSTLASIGRGPQPPNGAPSTPYQSAALGQCSLMPSVVELDCASSQHSKFLMLLRAHWRVSKEFPQSNN